MCPKNICGGIVVAAAIAMISCSPSPTSTSDVELAASALLDYTRQNAEYDARIVIVSAEGSCLIHVGRVDAEEVECDHPDADYGERTRSRQLGSALLEKLRQEPRFKAIGVSSYAGDSALELIRRTRISEEYTPSLVFLSPTAFVKTDTDTLYLQLRELFVERGCPGCNLSLNIKEFKVVSEPALDGRTWRARTLRDRLPVNAMRR